DGDGIRLRPDGNVGNDLVRRRVDDADRVCRDRGQVPRAGAGEGENRNTNRGCKDKRCDYESMTAPKSRKSPSSVRRPPGTMVDRLARQLRRRFFALQFERFVLPEDRFL